MIPPDQTMVRIIGVCSGVNTITTLRFMEVADGIAKKQALAAAIRDRFLPAFKTPCAAAMMFTSIEVRVLGIFEDAPYTLPTEVVGGGSQLGAHQVALQWNLQTGQAGRRGRGRLFVPGIFTGAMQGGLVATVIRTSLNAEMVTMRNRWAIGGSEQYHLGVFSRQNNTIYAVVDLSYNTVFSTLRSRRLGTGI